MTNMSAACAIRTYSTDRNVSFIYLRCAVSLMSEIAHITRLSISQQLHVILTLVRPGKNIRLHLVFSKKRTIVQECRGPRSLKPMPLFLKTAHQIE